MAQPTERDGVFVDVLVPSAVAVVGEEKLVGEGARRVAATGPARGLHQDRRFFLETKNFMGTRRVYGGAPEGFRTPVEIAGHILEYLAEAIRTADPSQVDRQVVTVPGSFNPAQRRDTRRAAELAGLSLGPGDLLDEPLAAFLDFASRHELPPLAQRQRLAVFDWGGGTCDVAIFEVQSDGGGGPIAVAPLAVSRYHRLGGGDVDAAIVYEVLLPQLVAQNGLGQFELTYLDKKGFAEPALRPIAEALKIGLARELARLRGLGRLSSVSPEQIIKTQPGSHQVPLANGRTVELVSPKLSLAKRSLFCSHSSIRTSSERAAANTER